MVQDASTELAGLRTAVDRLTHGLHLMLETQATHTEMLRAVLQAATELPPEGGKLENTLTAILTQLRDQRWPSRAGTWIRVWRRCWVWTPTGRPATRQPAPPA